MAWVTRTRLTFFIAVVLQIIVLGRVHLVVHGGRLGITLCSKERWALRSTFVDVDDYLAEQPLRLRPEKQRGDVARALLRCGVAQSAQDARDLYWQALDLAIHERGLRAELRWVVRTYEITASEADCKALEPIAEELAPEDQRTSCGTETRPIWVVE